MSFVDTEFGRLHVLYSHVGTPGPGGLQVSEEDFQRTLDLNVKSAFYCTSFAEPLLRRAAGQASVIYTASVSGLVGSLFAPLYSSARAAWSPSPRRSRSPSRRTSGSTSSLPAPWRPRCCSSSSAATPATTSPRT